MKKICSNNRWVRFLTLLLTAAFILGCQGEQTEEVPVYDGWKTFGHGHFVFHFPEGNYWGKEIESLANAFERYLHENCDFLGIEIPVDTIHFYIYDTEQQAEQLTGRQLPFHTDRTIHWDGPPYYGRELARFLIDKWGVRRTDFDFLYDGLATLRDYSSINYHHLTTAYIEMEKYIPLDTLIDNAAYARQKKVERQSEAASLVAFLTYHFGINRFKMLWQSTGTFEEAIRELYDMDLATLEERWLEFAAKFFEGIEMKTIQLTPGVTQ